MEKMTIDSKFADQTGEIMVVELGGHVDQSNSYELQKMFDNIIDSGCYKVIIDFGKLYYMSSAGWGIFVGEIKRFRDGGGDIKLANMNDDIFDVYSMLEFYHILEDYATIEEAAAAFRKEEEELDLVTSKDESEKQAEDESEEQEILGEEEIEIEDDNSNNDWQQASHNQDRSSTEILDITSDQNFRSAPTEFVPRTLKKDVKLAELPLPEKIKRVIAENPLIGVFGIRRILKHEHFGYTKVSIFKLMKLLKDLDLNTREKRYRYYRSC